MIGIACHRSKNKRPGREPKGYLIPKSFGAHESCSVGSLSQPRKGTYQPGKGQETASP
jgi:hypothetical protein